MRHLTTRVAAVAVALAAVGYGGCTRGDSGPPQPVVFGLVNQENGGPLGSFPEWRRDAEAAVRYVNEELGGVAGRPVRLEVCTTDGTGASSEACANQVVAAGPVAVLGGIDLGAGSAMAVYEAAKVPYLGMTPALGDELVNPTAFMLAGGVVADLLAQTEYITGTLKATKVGVVHLDLPGLGDAAILAARAILQKRGVSDLKIAAEKAGVTDFTAAVRAATAANPDVLMVIFPAEACAKVLQAARALRVRARLFLPSACATPAVLDAPGGAANGVTFASSFLPPSDTGHPDVAAYVAALGRYGPVGAAPSFVSQPGFALVVSVRQVLSGLDRNKVTPANVAKEVRAARDEPAFMGHRFTCDGQVVTILPALCSTSVRLVEYRGGGRFDDVAGDWVSGAPLVKLLTG